MVELNPALSVVTLNINSIHTPFKSDVQTGFKKSKAHLYAIFEQEILNMKWKDRQTCKTRVTKLVSLVLASDKGEFLRHILPETNRDISYD